jgi:hypothetical protein
MCLIYTPIDFKGRIQPRRLYLLEECEEFYFCTFSLAHRTKFPFLIRSLSKYDISFYSIHYLHYYRRYYYCRFELSLPLCVCMFFSMLIRINKFR